jgi:tetratricopeptide (TPR) repeat protein
VGGRHGSFGFDRGRDGRHGGIHFGFGFYSQSLWRPRAYPVYYPVYSPPVIIESPTYVMPEAAPQDDYAPEAAYEPADEPMESPGTAYGAEPALSVPAEQLEQMISDGTRLFREGDYGQAADLFQRAAGADPRNADARLAYGIAEFAVGDFRLAAAAVRQGIAISPEIVNTALDLRDNYGNAGDFDRHFDRLAQRVESEPGDGDALLVLGFIYHFVGDRQDSEDVFQQIKAEGWADARLADVFLNAKPAPQSASAAGE